MGIIIIITGNK